MTDASSKAHHLSVPVDFFLESLPGEGVVKDERVDSRVRGFETALKGLLMCVTSSQRNQNLYQTLIFNTH